MYRLGVYLSSKHYLISKEIYSYEDVLGLSFGNYEQFLVDSNNQLEFKF